MISIRQITEATKCNIVGLTDHYPSFVEICAKYDINSQRRIAAFLANACHETGGFRRFEENLNYSEKGLLATWPKRFTQQQAIELAHEPENIANHVYFQRYGNNQIGDGWKYRGRGIFQTTFKDNYKKVADALKVNFIDFPELLAQKPYAMYSAGYFWDSHKLNQLAELQNIKAITKVINGGLIGLEERVFYYENLLKIMQ